MEKNEQNMNARGGTELMEERIREYIDFEDEGIQLICSRVRNVDPDKKKILWLHDLAQDPEVSHLRNGGWQSFDRLVFVSHYQRAMYNKILGVPYDAGIVINNCIDIPEESVKPSPKDGPVKLIYFSTPHRGLNVLYSVFNKLYETYGEAIELDVYSSYDLYGWGERDEAYQDLFKLCEDHPGINYNKSIPNEELQEKLKTTHILAYPSTWEETSCLVLIESMVNGLHCVHSSLGALPETSMSMTPMYPYYDDINAHAATFYYYLERSIMNIMEDLDENKHLLRLTSNIAANKYDVNNIIPQWKGLVNQL